MIRVEMSHWMLAGMRPNFFLNMHVLPRKGDRILIHRKHWPEEYFEEPNAVQVERDMAVGRPGHQTVEVEVVGLDHVITEDGEHMAMIGFDIVLYADGSTDLDT